MNSKIKKTISLYYVSAVIALFIFGCSATQSQEVENNSNGTPQNVEQSNAEIIAYTPTAEFIPTARPTKTETPSPTPDIAKETEYQQMRDELNKLNDLLRLLDSPNGLKTNALVDYNTYELKLLKKYIGYFLELACNRPELLRDLEFEPFYLETPNQATNLDINVQGCNITRETLKKLEESGHTIILSHPIFSEGTDTSLTTLFPGINEEAFRYNGSDGKSDGGAFDSLESHSGMALGSLVYPSYVLEMSQIDSSYGFDFTYAVAKFEKNVQFSIPSNTNGEMVFSSIMIVPNGTSASEIERMVTKGTGAHFGFFSTKIWFTSSNFPKD